MLELLSVVKVKNIGEGELRGRSHPTDVSATRYDVLIDGKIHANIPEDFVSLVAKPDPARVSQVVR